MMTAKMAQQEPDPRSKWYVEKVSGVDLAPTDRRRRRITVWEVLWYDARMLGALTLGCSPLDCVCTKVEP